MLIIIYPTNPVHPTNPAKPRRPRQPRLAPRANTADPANPVYFSVYVCIRMNACLYGFFYVCIYAYMQNLVNI